MGTTASTLRDSAPPALEDDGDDGGAGPSRLPRLYRQVAGSDLGTVFYTPGGVGGWALDLLLRLYLAYARRYVRRYARRYARVARARGVVARAARVAQA